MSYKVKAITGAVDAPHLAQLVQEFARVEGLEAALRDNLAFVTYLTLHTAFIEYDTEDIHV